MREGVINMKIYLRLKSFYVGNKIITERDYVDEHTKSIDENGYCIARYRHVKNLWLGKRGTIIQILEVPVDKVVHTR